jgi:hypothetical protein
MAQSLLLGVVQSSASLRGKRLQYTIEQRQLTREASHLSASHAALRRTTIEAPDADQAITRFVLESQSELVSFTPVRGRESIATIKKDEAVYLVRVYAD